MSPTANRTRTWLKLTSTAQGMLYDILGPKSKKSLITENGDNIKQHQY